jgi:hypothetical protein
VDVNKPVTINVSLSGNAAKNYRLTNGTNYVLSGGKITAKPITITGAEIVPKVYDRTTVAEVSRITFSGLIAGETLVKGIDYESSGTFDDSDVGTGHSVTITTRLLAAQLSSNYLLSGNTTFTLPNQTIYETSLAPSLLSFTPLEAEYDGTPKSVTIVPVEGVVGLRDDHIVYYNGSPSPPTEIGEYIISVEVLPLPTTLSANVAPTALSVSSDEEALSAVFLSPRPLAEVAGYGRIEIPEVGASPSPIQVSPSTRHKVAEPSPTQVSSSPCHAELVSASPIASVVSRSGLSYASGLSYSSGTHVSLGTFRIRGPRPELSSFAYSTKDCVYDGLPHPVTVGVAPGVNGLGSPIRVKYNGSNNTPVNVGKYVISVDVPVGSRYGAIEDLVLDSFEITQKVPSLADLSYSVPESIEYDGLPHGVTISAAAGITGLGTPFVLKCNGIADSVPVGIGTYRFTLDLPAGLNYAAKSGLTLGTLMIVKATPSSESFAYDLSSVLYDGKPHTIEVSPHDNILGMGRITVLYNGSTRVPVEAGTYPITLNITSGTNYTSVEGLLLGDFEIVSETTPGEDTHISASSLDRVWSSGNTLHIELSRTGDVRIYSLSGVIVKSLSIAAGVPYSTSLPPGFYVIISDGSVHKVRIH